MHYPLHLLGYASHNHELNVTCGTAHSHIFIRVLSLGLSFLGLSLIAAYFYEQAPHRTDSSYEEDEEEDYSDSNFDVIKTKLNTNFDFVKHMSTALEHTFTATRHCRFVRQVDSCLR